MIGKAMPDKMTGKVVGKNSSFFLILNENNYLLLLNFLSHFFYLVAFIWEF